MTYQLGIDLGTTYTAAAVLRDGTVEMVTLGNRSASIPSVIFLKEDDALLTGDAASRRGLSEPDRIARQFKRRMGDPTPLLLGDTPYSAEALMAKLLRWTVDAVTEGQGAAPDRVAVTHPANWGPYKKDLLDQAIRIADLEDVDTLSEPEAAAIYYASNERVAVGSVIAVYDLGGGTFDAAVLRKREAGWEILGTPEGIERLGGIDFDEAVFSHVRGSLREQFDALDTDDPIVLDAVARVRDDVVEAKEALSSDTDVSIPVMLPTVSTHVRLTRAEFEAMIRPTLQETIGALRRALRSAAVEPEEVSAVLLVGGSSRIPLVTQLVSAEFGRPVAVDAHPKHAIALGAALAAAPGGRAPLDAGSVEADPEADPVGPADRVAAPVPAAPHAATAQAPSPVDPAPAGPAPKKLPVGVLVGGLMTLLALVGLAVVVLGGGGDDDPGEALAAAEQPADTTEDPEGPDHGDHSDSTAPPETDVDGDTDGDAALPAAGIAGITVQDGRYVIEYEPFGFTPEVNNPDTFHVHFFWDTLPVVNAGTNGPDPGHWLLWDTPFTVSDGFFDVSARPEGARQICVVIADTAHAVADVDGDGATDTDTGNCFDLPA